MATTNIHFVKQTNENASSHFCALHLSVPLIYFKMRYTSDPAFNHRKIKMRLLLTLA